MQDQTTSHTSPFGVPESGDLQSGRFEYMPSVEYSAAKTPAAFAAQMNAEMAANARATFKLGFHYYDKEAKQNVAINAFSFVVLDVFSSICGSAEQSGGSYVNYFSNFVKNSRNEPFALRQKGIARPIMSGFYKGKDDAHPYAKLIDGNKINKIPDGASFQKHFRIYWIEGDLVLDLQMTTMVEREIKNTIAAAEAKAGRNVKPERVQTFALADGGAFWGFMVNKFKRVAKDGTPYDGKGDLFLVPEFHCGIVKTEGVGANPDLHAKCLEMQTNIRTSYAAEVERRAQFGETNEHPESNGGQRSQPATRFPPLDDGSFPSAERVAGDNIQSGSIEHVSQPAGIDFEKRTAAAIDKRENTDDLPF